MGVTKTSRRNAGTIFDLGLRLEAFEARDAGIEAIELRNDVHVQNVDHILTNGITFFPDDLFNPYFDVRPLLSE